jgi:hypothetical protein
MTALMAMVLGQPFARPAYSAPALSDYAVDDAGVSPLQRDNLVRLRSGDLLTTVDAVKGNVVDCIWTDPTDQATSRPRCFRNSEAPNDARHRPIQSPG